MTNESMRDRGLTWETLNAYVDGELDPASAANVAAILVADRSLAARIATLARLKASAAELCGQEQSPPALVENRPTQKSIFAVVAAAILLLVAASVASLHLFPRSQVSWLDEALAAERTWMSSAARTSAAFQDNLAISANVAGRPLDLSDAGLKIVYATAIDDTHGHHGAFLGYRGPHGCRVGLWAGGSQRELGSRPQVLDRGDVQIRAWQNKAGGYALLSRGMDPARLDRLAEIVARVSDPASHLDDGDRVALREIPHTGAACRV